MADDKQHRESWVDDDGVEHYYGGGTIDADRDLQNADWTKKSWDIPASNVEELRRYLAEQMMTVEYFKTLPVYQNNVEQLGWLRDL